MASLPDWLEHLSDLPDWALVVDDPGRTILWVNSRLAADNGRPRDWFVGRVATEVWPDSSRSAQLDSHSVDEDREVDSIEYAIDLRGAGHWFHLRRTPIGDRRLLVVGEDVTAQLQLAGIRLLLGKGVVGESRTRLEPEVVRRLLAGDSLEVLADKVGMATPDLLSKLSLLVSEDVHPDSKHELSAIHREPAVEPGTSPGGAAAPVAGERLPDWLSHYEDVPCRVVLLEHPSARILWVNRYLAEFNRLDAGELIGRDLGDMWSEAHRWVELGGRCIAEGRAVEEVEMGQNLHLGEQIWMVMRCVPVSGVSVLVTVDDVTAQIRLRALRILIGLRPSGPDAVSLAEPFARLLLEGKNVPNICAALELSESAVRSKLAGIVYRPTAEVTRN